jgi:inorganic pyrophosphatase
MVTHNAWHDVCVGKKAPQIINVIIEIPKDSDVKYELDQDTGLLRLDRFLHSTSPLVPYPGDYGFVPRTLWYDEDPLDIIVLTHKPVCPLTMASVRVIGMLSMIDDNEKDDKIIAVYDCDTKYAEYNDVSDIPKHVIMELEHFFDNYKKLEGKKCQVLQVLGKKEAYKDIELARKMYEKKFGSIKIP